MFLNPESWSCEFKTWPEVHILEFKYKDMTLCTPHVKNVIEAKWFPYRWTDERMDIWMDAQIDGHKAKQVYLH